MSTYSHVPFNTESERARAYLNAASTRLLEAAQAYRRAWEKQCQALEDMGEAFEAVQRAFGEQVPRRVRSAIAGYNATAAAAALLQKVPMGEEAREALELEVRALEDVTSAARRVADALAAAGGDA